MKKASRKVIFVNASAPEERAKLLKPVKDNTEMEDDCEEVYTCGLLQQYIKRPVSLEHSSLADWAAWYDSSRKPYVKESFNINTDDLPLETANDDDDDALCIENN